MRTLTLCIKRRWTRKLATYKEKMNDKVNKKTKLCTKAPTVHEFADGNYYIGLVGNCVHKIIVGGL